MQEKRVVTMHKRSVYEGRASRIVIKVYALKGEAPEVHSLILQRGGLK